MVKRERTVRLQFFVAEEEAAMIHRKMALAGTKNFSMYARKMLIDGFVIRQDFSELKVLVQELASLSRSINQIALRVNETRSIYAQDIQDLREQYYEVKRACTRRLLSVIGDEHSKKLAQRCIAAKKKEDS